ncbi:MAG TPA: TonB-dependent receptor [Bacteroidetes bacterium]|nr:TonB-dependent receptor [Bacteroidota bacterium]
MKRNIIIIILSFLFLYKLSAQDYKQIVITGDFSNLTFEEFAGIMKKDYGIFIYYKPEWISNIRINARGDSLKVLSILENALSPGSVNFVQIGSKQFFLTGEKEISESHIASYETDIMQSDSLERSIAEQYFANVSYEQAVKVVTIGNGNNADNSGMSVLSGRIMSGTSGEPVAGVTIVVEGTSKGVITNADGEYSLPVETGSVFNLNISCMGMEPETYLVNMNGSGILNIEMIEKLIDIQEVIVRSGRHDNVQGMQMGFQKIEMKHIKSIPVVLGERDILKIANMMPGVQTVGEGSAGFNVRGSSSDQNLFLINEVPVLNTGHLFGFFSAFNPDMVSDFNLYKSNFPVEFGGRLASVFDVSTRKGNKKNFGARGGISPVTGSLLFEAPLIRDKASVILGARSTYSDWILKRINDPDISSSDASFYDLMGSVHVVNQNNSSWQLFGYHSKDRFTLARTNDYMYENLGFSVVYDKNLHEKWKMKVAAVMSDYSNYHNSKEQLSEAFEHRFEVKSQELKINFTGFPWLKHRMGFGLSGILHHLDQGSYDPYGTESLLEPNDFGQEKGLEYAVYTFDEASLTDKLTVYGGLRYSFYSYLGPNQLYRYGENLPYEQENITDTLNYGAGEFIDNYSGPEYRLSLNYRINPDLSLKFSYNRMRQYLFMLSNTVSVAPTDRWKLADPYITPPVSDQLSFGIYRDIRSASLESSAEVYYKKGKNIVEYKDGADLTSSPDFETLILQGRNDSYGLELMLKRNEGRFTGWISYTWSRSLITVDGEQEWQKINKGLTYPANYDKPHSFNFVGNISISRRISLASNMVFSSGRSITYPTGISYFSGVQVVNYSLRNEYRIPDYFRLDVSVNIEGNLKKEKLIHGSWSFSVYNLTGRNNAYSVYFKNQEGRIKGYKQSIYGVPIFTVSYNFKLGNYATE